MNKLYPSAHAALEDVLKDNMTLAVGGFGLCGIPEALILAVRELVRPEPDGHQQTTPGWTARVWVFCWRAGRSKR